MAAPSSPVAATVIHIEDSSATEIVGSIIARSASPTATPRKRSLSVVDQEPPQPAPVNSSIELPTVIPAKKRLKQTAEEKAKQKEAKEKEREAKEREKEEKRKAKEEEQRLKEEARKEKERKKEEDRQRREAEKQRKEEEKQRKEDERRKKDEKQLRINKFFEKAPDPKLKISVHLSSDLASTGPAQPASDYSLTFQPFFVKPNVTMASLPFQKDTACGATTRGIIDKAMAAQENVDAPESEPRQVTRLEILELLCIPPHQTKSRGCLLPYTAKDILARVENPDDPALPPIPLKSKGKLHSSYYLKLLNTLPKKHLQFAEDIRPPYCGTYTRRPLEPGLCSGRKPFERALPGVNYDYDSGAEWVADDEGEDILSDDEDDESLGSNEDLDGFLDDEDDPGMNRNRLSVLVPTNSGLCWEDEHGINARPDLDGMRIKTLIEGVYAPIDPFSDSYWIPASSATNTRAIALSAMNPPRRPLATFNQNLAALSTKNHSDKKIVPPDQIDAFKQAINGSDMTKAGLIEVLKKEFPKIPKDAIKNTLDLVAERVGDKRDDKRWVLK